MTFDRDVLSILSGCTIWRDWLQALCAQKCTVIGSLIINYLLVLIWLLHALIRLASPMRVTPWHQLLVLPTSYGSKLIGRAILLIVVCEDSAMIGSEMRIVIRAASGRNDRLSGC
jgi:hypothetical protein